MYIQYEKYVTQEKIGQYRYLLIWNLYRTTLFWNIFINTCVQYFSNFKRGILNVNTYVYVCARTLIESERALLSIP